MKGKRLKCYIIPKWSVFSLHRFCQFLPEKRFSDINFFFISDYRLSQNTFRFLLRVFFSSSILALSLLLLIIFAVVLSCGAFVEHSGRVCWTCATPDGAGGDIQPFIAFFFFLFNVTVLNFGKYGYCFFLLRLLYNGYKNLFLQLVAFNLFRSF